MSGLKIIQTSTILKKKLKQSKNRKKAWRKQADPINIDGLLDQELEDEIKTGALGEDIYIDMVVGDEAEDQTKENTENNAADSNSTEAPMALEYTIDTTTGLKKTDRPKKTKLLHAHRFLAGLPGGVKGPYKGITRGRKIDTLEHRLALKERSQQGHSNSLKAEIKQQRAFTSLKKAKKAKKGIQKLSFDDNLWDEGPAQTRASSFTADAMSHTKQVMKTAAINNRGSQQQPTLMPALPLPHPGLSYNPDVASHQQLLQEAVAKEEKRGARAKRVKDTKSKDFPMGALPVNALTMIHDMSSEYREHPGKLKKAATSLDTQEITEAPISVKGKERVTHQQRLKKSRFMKQKRDELAAKMLKKRENEVHRIKEFTRDLDAESTALKERDTRRQNRALKMKYAPAKHFEERDVEVALGSDLRSSLLNVQPSSNPLTNVLKHKYRRGLLPTHGRARRYYGAKKVVKSGSKRVSRKMQTLFTEEEMTFTGNEKKTIKK